MPPSACAASRLTLPPSACAAARLTLPPFACAAARLTLSPFACAAARLTLSPAACSSLASSQGIFSSGISPSISKPCVMSAMTTSIIEIFFIFAPFGIVMILPTEPSIPFFVISRNPTPERMSLSSGYSCTSSYTDLLKSIFFAISLLTPILIYMYKFRLSCQ